MAKIKTVFAVPIQGNFCVFSAPSPTSSSCSSLSPSLPPPPHAISHPPTAPAPIGMPQARNTTNLMGRTIILRSAAAEAEQVDADADAFLINRALERFTLRMECARRLAWFNGFIDIRSIFLEIWPSIGRSIHHEAGITSKVDAKHESSLSIYLTHRSISPSPATHLPRARIQEKTFFPLGCLCPSLDYHHFGSRLYSPNPILLLQISIIYHGIPSLIYLSLDTNS